MYQKKNTDFNNTNFNFRKDYSNLRPNDTILSNYRIMQHYNTEDKNAIDMFFQAVDELNYKSVKYYLQKLSIYSKNNEGYTILHYIIINHLDVSEDKIIEKIKARFLPEKTKI